MNDTYIVTTYVVIDDVLKAYGFTDDCRAKGTAAQILTVGVIAAKYFQNHHERALCIMTRLGYVGSLSLSRPLFTCGVGDGLSIDGSCSDQDQGCYDKGFHV